MTKRVIFTLDARDNVMLEVIRDYFKLKPERMYQEIQAMQTQMETELAKKQIKYETSNQKGMSSSSSS